MIGWDRIEADTWELACEHFPRPWPRELAAQDLRHLEGQVRVGAIPRVPGWVTLTERWGWTKHGVCSLVAARESWADPHRASDVDRTPTGRASDADRTSRDGPTPRKQRKSDVDRTPTGRASDADRTSRARESTRASTDPPKTPIQAPPVVPAPVEVLSSAASDPAVLRAWGAIRDLGELPAAALRPRPTKPQAEAVRARLSDHSHDEVLLVAALVFLGPDAWWREHNPDPGSWCRPKHFPALLTKARASQHRATGPPGASIPALAGLAGALHRARDNDDLETIHPSQELANGIR